MKMEQEKKYKASTKRYPAFSVFSLIQYICVGTQEGYKSLKMLSDSISEDAIFQNFLGRHAPRPPSIGMLRMHVCFAHNNTT